MATILPRSAWTSTPEGWNRSPLYVQPEGIAAHHPGDGDVTYANLTKDQVAAKLRGYRTHHVRSKGWADIGYNYGIDQAGRIWSLAGKRQAAHAASPANPGANRTLYGVLFVVGNNEPLTDKAIAAFRDLRATLGATLPVYGHQQVSGASTACPGRVMDAIKSGALAEAPGGGKPAPAPGPEKLRVDGYWGAATTRRLQQVLGTKVDGVISGQVKGSWNAALESVQWGTGGSDVVRALQRRLGVTADGNLGPQTIRALQRHYRSTADGYLSRPSTVVQALQQALNKGTI